MSSGWLEKDRSRPAVAGFAEAPSMVVSLAELETLTDQELGKMYKKQRRSRERRVRSEERQVRLVRQAGSFKEAREDPGLDAPFFRVVASE